MQLSHLKEVVQNITDATQLEFQLQRCQEEKGVAVLDIYNTEWGSCKTLGETFKRLYTDVGDTIVIRFFAVECDTITKQLEDHSTDTKKPPRSVVEYHEDTKSAFWGSILQKRCGHSKPYFVLYKEGKMRGFIEGVDTPNICKLINDLCQPDPITQCLTNPDGLKFWKANFSVTKTEIPFSSFVEAAERVLSSPLTPQKVLVLEAEVGATGGVCTADGLQAWLKDSATLLDQLNKIVNAPDKVTVDERVAPIGDPEALTNANPAELSHSSEMQKEPGVETEEAEEGEAKEASLQEVRVSSSGVSDQNEQEQQSPAGEKGLSSTDNVMTNPESQVDSEGGDAAMANGASQMESSEAPKQMTPEGPVDAANALPNGGKMNQIFIDRWITVTEEELKVWNQIAELPLHYPSTSASPLDASCEDATRRAGDWLVAAASLPTLVQYLQHSGLTETQIYMMGMAARQKVGSDGPSYGKLALLMMTSHQEELAGLLPEPGEFVTALAEGTLLGCYAPLGFSALCLCASEAFPDEYFFYLPPPSLVEQLSQLAVGEEVPLPALTPLQTSNFSEDSVSMKIVGLPKVIELASGDESEYTVVLSQWFAKLQVIDKTEMVVTAQFVELLCEQEYMDFSNAYVERLMKDENDLDKKIASKGSMGVENNAEYQQVP